MAMRKGLTLNPAPLIMITHGIMKSGVLGIMLT